jgi:pyruvate/2-oxoglutarate dehydrogenase complex dihydrolipoamide dehydrogenase (E3) component
MSDHAGSRRYGVAGLRTGIVERELIRGECAYGACIPSKTLLRPGEVVNEFPTYTEAYPNALEALPSG